MAICFLIGIVLLNLFHVKCDENMATVFRKIREIDGEMVEIRKKIVSDIELAMESLQFKIQHHFEENVRAKMAEILQGESIEEMLRSQFVSELRELKHENHQMKSELDHVMTSLRDVQEERETFQEALLKAERNVSELTTCSKYVVDSTILQRDLEKCNDHITAQRNQCDRENSELKQNLIAMNATYKLQKNITMATATDQSDPGITNSNVTTVATTSSTTTTKPEEEKSRIIVAPYSSVTSQHFGQVNINSNSFRKYPFLHLRSVYSLVYVSKLRKLLIGLYRPNKIVSSNLDGYGVKTMREGVWSYSMAVDEDRETVFIGTRSPKKTISRMTTKGTHFTTISTLTNYSWPYAIAVNPKEEKIYVCDQYNVLTMTYDGRNLLTLVKGTNMYALSIDIPGGVLYYNDDKKLMKMSLSDNDLASVATLNYPLKNVVHYNNKVYFSEYHASVDTSTVGVVELGHEIVNYELQHITMEKIDALLICLVP